MNAPTPIAGLAQSLLDARRDGAAPTAEPTPRATLPVSRVRRLWERLGAIYGTRWHAAYGATPHRESGELTAAGDTWSRVLAQLSDEQLLAGLDACVTGVDGWPPSLPEFRLRCLGAPPLVTVQAELQSSDAQRTSFGLLVLRHLDQHALREADRRESARMIADAYELACGDLSRGVELPEVRVAIIHEPPAPDRPADFATARQRIAELRRAAGLDGAAA